MRLRRLSAIFWTTCIIAVVFILYVMTDLSFKLPSIKPAMQELDDSKWSSFESKLRNIEMELNQHHAVVGEIRSAVDQIVDKSQNEHLQNTVKQKKYKVVESIPISNVKKYESKTREYKVVGDEPPKMHQKLNMSTCAIQKDKIPKTDVQMLDLYETTMFEDTDGGAWKQGWSIEFNARQWSQKNKLKVFIVPHSHNDPGWLMTFENYYRTQTKTIFKNIVEKMTEGAERKFIWAETCYLALWWTNDATETEKAAFKNLLDKGQLEIVTGGWVMNDEANSHWLSVVQQLTTGHQWLIDNLGYTPKNAWSIDPFGYSSSQPYLLKLAGFDNSVIQRVHYIVKKELARSRQLEFKWRQLWDGTGKTDMFTHLFPFYSYDVPHSCGPDPKVCCQFDFKRLPGHGVTCPWGIAPRKIVTKNVQERASVILDQWRKKAQLYKSNVVLFPLGDDFRYDNANEWDNQFGNYDLLIDYINNKEEWNAEVHFGTLTDYFKALHEEVKMADFPSLSGDFFTYADRNNHYWSGYFTSRPFYKNMDRVLLSYVRAAEIATAQATLSPATPAVLALQLRDRSEQARRALALFQHHDGVTGTARNDVVVDYAKKMHTAIKYCQSAIQQAAYHLLKRPTIQDQTQEDVFFEVDDVWRRHDEVPSRITIVLDTLAPARRLVLHNGLTVSRLEVITLFVSSPHVEVFDPQGSPVSAQVSPAAQGERRLGFAPNKFQLSFVASVGALGLSVYTVSLRDAMAINKYTSFSRVRVYNANYWTVDLPKMFQVEQPSEHLVDTFNVRVGNGTGITADYNGLLRSIRTKTGTEVPVNMQFVQYDTLHRSDNNSGAYLFIPSGPAQQFKPDAYPEIVVVEGPLKSTVYTSLVGPKTAEIMVAISLYENPSLPHPEVEITNTLLIDPAVDDVEIAMRFDTEINNGDAFYTDLNGMQMIRRKRFSKLPLQANFYPLPAAAYLQDETARLSLLTATPLGVAALQSGQIEVMQDRRLSRDDNRGMNQGVMDNVRTRHTFKLIYETATQCKNPPAPEHPSGQLTLGAHMSQQFLLQPLLPMQYTARDAAARPTFAGADAIGADIVLASFNAHVSAKNKQQKIVQGIGLTFHRVYLETCYGSHDDIAQYYPASDGVISLGDIIGMKPTDVYDSTLTFSRIRGLVPYATVTLCPNEIRSVFLKTMKNG